MRSKSLAILFAACASSTSLLHADVIDTTWLGGSGSWNDPTKWSGGVVPNNTPADTFRVVVPSGVVTTSGTISLDSLAIASPASVASPSRMTWNIWGQTQIDGLLKFETGVINLGTDATLAGTGTLLINAREEFGSLVHATAGALTIAAEMHVHMRPENAQIGDVDRPLVNHGLIIAGGTPLGNQSHNTSAVAGSQIQNFGEIRSLGALGLRGQFTTSSLGALTGPGFEFRGVLDNTGQTLDLNGTSQWFIGTDQAGDPCTINGGTITTSGGGMLQVRYVHGGTLNNVTLNGKMFLGPAGRVILQDRVLRGNGEVAMSSDNTAPEGPARVLTPGDAPLTVNSGMLVHGGGTGFNSGFGNGPGLGSQQTNFPLAALVNHGNLRADDGTQTRIAEFTINAVNTTHDGTLQAFDRSFIYATGNVTFQPGGVLDLELSQFADGGMLRVAGALNLTAPADQLLLTPGPGTATGTFYRIALASSVTGQFDSIPTNVELEYRNGTEIWARFVPEPGTAAMIGALSILTTRRRRIHRCD